MQERRRTATSNFGVSRRESHDASAFYDRFRPPQLLADSTVLPPRPLDEAFVCGDSRSMDAVADGSVALVVTSPPYFAGKKYEEEIEREGFPSSYLEYLETLGDVLAECVRKLEPGGRIAVNARPARRPALVGGTVVRYAEFTAFAIGAAIVPALSTVEHAHDRGLHGPHSRRVGGAFRDCPTGGPPGALSRRATGALGPPLHLQGRPGPRPVHGERIGPGGGGPARSPLRRLRP